MALAVRTRLTIWYVTLLLISFLAFGAAFSYSLFKTFMTRIDTRITSVANMLPHTAINPQGRLIIPGDFDIILSRFFGIRTADNYIQILDGRGRIVARSSNLRGMSLPLTKTAYGNALKGMATYEVVKRLGSFPVRLISRPVILKGKGLVAIMQVGTSLEEVEEVFHSLFYIFVVGAVVSVAVAGAGGWFLARKALGPVSEITEMARRIEAENLNERIKVDTTDDEIGKLAATINEMIERLEASFKQIKQFTGDASHELKTPLTILKGEMEIALRSGDPEAMREAITSGLEEIDRMNYIVRNLLDLARIEAEREEAGLDRVRLDRVLTERFEHLRRLALEKGVELSILNNTEAVVLADPVRMGQLFFNLIDNAIKYTPPGGRVAISLEKNTTMALFRVKDTGVGIPEEHLPYIFDRFYRVDKARSREMGGAGLGLSICREIAETYRGRIRAESRPGSGTTFTVELPLAEKAA